MVTYSGTPTVHIFLTKPQQTVCRLGAISKISNQTGNLKYGSNMWQYFLVWHYIMLCELTEVLIFHTAQLQWKERVYCAMENFTFLYVALLISG
jgi:hypothetical protein